MSTAWAEPVVAFFMRELPQQERGGWNHYFSTAYQVGCDALIALGHAKRELNWMFFRHWRLKEGWLSQEKRARSIEIFHDRLAIAMRKAVVYALFPGSEMAQVQR